MFNSPCSIPQEDSVQYNRGEKQSYTDPNLCRSESWTIRLVKNESYRGGFIKNGNIMDGQKTVIETEDVLKELNSQTNDCSHENRAISFF